MAETPPLSPVEGIKTRSRHLRGTLVESLADPVTGALADPDTQLIKFHGSYQQDDRDIREERRLQKLEPAYSFMVRTRLPAGVATPAQWLALTDLARTYGNGSLRLTTRQAFQIHGILKRNLKANIAAMNAALVDSIAACGDVNRNVMASANPLESALHAEAHRYAAQLSAHLLPNTRAYHEIWLDREKVAGTPDVEPIYGDTYLPRKFKAGIVVPPENDVDVFSQDLGFIAITEKDAADTRRIVGFNLVVGGGMGTTHGEPGTYARLADVLGYFDAAHLCAIGEAVLTTQRDFGDRTNRKHARLKYTIAERGVDWFRGEVERRSGVTLAPPRPFEFTSRGDRFGWTVGTGGRWHLTLRIESGRIADREAAAGQPAAPRWLSGLEAIARIHTGHFRLSPNQNLVIADVDASARPGIDDLVREYGLDIHATARPVRRDALACVALPTCSLAMAEAERYLPGFLDALDVTLQQHGLQDEPLSVRITGCPNGCARPFLAEIALVGKAPERYNLHLGGDGLGQRLNRLYRENITEPEIIAALDPLFARYAAERTAGERFGDWVWRNQLVKAP
jgi:sulfite reductase (NADPH) hemoprotein beta-component